MAKRANFDDVVLGVDGAALEGIEVTVYESDGSTEATIYGSKSGGTTTNPIVTPSTGLVQFWASPGEYVLEFHDPELPARISDRIYHFQAVSGDTAGIDGAQVEDSGIDTLQLASNSVTNPKVADNAIGTAELIDDAVTQAKRASKLYTKVTKSSNQVINTDDPGELISFNTEVNDDLTIFPGSGTDLTIAATGTYTIHGYLAFQETIADGISRFARILVNGSAVAGSKSKEGGVNQPQVSVSTTVAITAGQTVQFKVGHSGGNNKNVQATLVVIREK